MQRPPEDGGCCWPWRFPWLWSEGGPEGLGTKKCKGRRRCRFPSSGVGTIAPARRRGERLPVEGERKRILVVDDDGELGELLRTYLDREGFACLHVTDGETGLREALSGARTWRSWT